MSARARLLTDTARWFDDGHFQRTLARRVACNTASDAGPALEALEGYLAQEINPALEGLGFTCTVLPNPVAGNGPLLVARRIEDPSLPTVLTYGHGDVVNGQDAQWRDGLQPWALTIEGDRWYGRGTADNKGQHTISLAALAQVIQARQGRLGYNVTVLLETGEEVGSPGLRELCMQERERLRADLLIACDGPRVHADKPTVFLGSRGGVNFTLRLQSRARAYHSGNWGGVLANPAIVISNAIASMVDGRGRIRVPGLLPPPISAAVRTALADVTIGGGDDDPVTDPLWGELGLSEAERLVGWNTLEVLAMVAGAPERPINAIPHTAVAHCQLRFVPGTRWKELESVVRSHLDDNGFGDVEVKVTMAVPATRLDLANPWVDWALNSIRRSVDKTPTLLPNLAGSLPNDVFSDILGLPTLWVPHSYPACAQHAPNEHLLAPVAREGLLLMAGLYWDLGEPGAAPWPDNTARH
ncbi:MAG: M20 family metallopeptidase [Rhodoferax sp.]|nr:M20 family metallopeptidase [Rhodoferax sp.]